MKSQKVILVILVCLLFVWIGCKAPVAQIDSAVKARIDFANKYDDEYPIQNASFSAEGNEKKTLNVSVISKSSKYDMKYTIELVVSDKLKKDAKVLGFEEILVEVYGDWSDDTIRRTIPLK